MEKLKNIAPDGEPLEAIYLPEKGMNLISYRKGETEIIDQETLPLFKERFAGLGALIGPHFHEQPSPLADFDLSLFPHAKTMIAEGRKDCFSHGIGRYASWKFVKSDTQIQAELKGSDTFHGIPLKQIEGQDFHMKYQARLLSDGLFISYFIESERPSVVGLHTYYALKGKGVLVGEVEEKFRFQKTWKPLPKEWTHVRPTSLDFFLPQTADFGFVPKLKHETDHAYQMLLKTDAYELHIELNTASNEEISFQVFSPENASYVCLEPLSARCPPKPRLTRSHLETKLQVFDINPS